MTVFEGLSILIYIVLLFVVFGACLYATYLLDEQWKRDQEQWEEDDRAYNAWLESVRRLYGQHEED